MTVPSQPPDEVNPGLPAGDKAVAGQGTAVASRTQRATANAIFAYGNQALAIASALFLTPLTLHRIDTRHYGYWLSSGELLGYVALLDLGIFGLVPWLIAEADGGKDLPRIRWLLSHTMLMAAVIMAGLLVFALPGAWLLGHAPGMDAAAWSAVARPLGIMLLLTLVNYGLSTFPALLIGLQDVVFVGAVNLGKSLLSFLIVVTVLRGGGQLYALAIGYALPNVLAAAAACWRARQTHADLLRGWPAPSLAGIRTLSRESLGPWISSMGVGLVERSQAMVILGLGMPAMAAVYAGTAKFTQVLSNLSATLVDSALVGIAQLHGENQPERMRVVVRALLRIQLAASGLVACLALAVNPSFVRLWLGDRFFAGIVFNALLALLLIVAGLAYSTVKIVAVQGRRLEVGRVTIIQGVVHLLATVGGGALFGLAGMAAGAVLACGIVTLREGLRLLRQQVGLAYGEIGRTVFFPWFARALPLLALAAVTGIVYRPTALWMVVLPAAATGLAYAYWMRPYWKGLPLPARLNRCLTPLGLGA